MSGASRPRPSCTTSAPSPPVSFTRSPQSRKREYRNASTQYSPTGFPPTYRPPRQPEPLEPEASTAPATTAASAPEAAQKDSAEPPPRVVPQPAEQSRPPARNANEENATEHAGQTVKQNSQTNARDEDAKADADVSRDLMSPAKRARPHDPAVKVMPLKYETCNVKDLGMLISEMLMDLVRLNDQVPLVDGQLTRFHSRAPPGISVRDYLNRLIVHATLSPPILLSMVFYVDRLCSMYPAFTISSLTVHRFLITAATVAAKGLSDSFWTNSLYARVGGVSVRELGLLELEFLAKVEWRIVPKPEILVDYYKGLVERGVGYVLEKEEVALDGA